MKNSTPKQRVGKHIWVDCKCFCHNEEHCKTPDCSCSMCYKHHQSPQPNRERTRYMQITITNDKKFEYATNEPPKAIVHIPFTSWIIVLW